MSKQPQGIFGLRLVLVIGLTLSLCAPATSLIWQDIAGELMSPACPGRTLINCTSGQSEQWRQLIQQQLANGKSKDDVLKYFVEMRGEEILASPPKKGFALMAWLLPLFVVVNGVGLIIAFTFRWVRKHRALDTVQETSSEGITSPRTSSSDVHRQRLIRELEDI